MRKKQSLEQGVRNRAIRGAVQSAVLATMVGAGLLTIAAMAPGVLKVMRYADPNWIAPRDPRQRLRETIYRMKRRGLVRFVERQGISFPTLTAKGEREAERIRVGHTGIPVPHRWDGRWRIVAFDIAEKRKQKRIQLRQILQRLGFMRLQDSVWVHPYESEEILRLIKLDLHLSKEVTYIVADAIENDRAIRGFFDLPLR